MSDLEESVKRALESSKASEKPEEYVNVSFVARIGADGRLEYSQPRVRLPWIPNKSKS